MASGTITNDHSMLGMNLFADSSNSKIYNGRWLSYNQSATLDLGATFRGVLFTTGFSADDHDGLYIVSSNTARTAIVIANIKSATNLTMATNGSQITLTNTSNTGSIYFTFLVFNGSITTVS